MVERRSDLRRILRRTYRAGVTIVGHDQCRHDDEPRLAVKQGFTELLRPVADEITTIQAILGPSRAPPATAAIEPWLAPTSQTGAFAWLRTKSTA
jgi:hypothetical protein